MLTAETTSQKVSEDKSKNLPGCFVLIVFVFIGFWLYHMATSSSDDNPTTSSDATAATTAATAGTTTASVGVLAGRDVAEAFSNYVGALQVKIFQAQMTFQVHMGQIQQAIQFNDLNKYRAAAEDLESSLKKIRDGLPATNAPDNLADADMPPFEKVQNAASDIISQYLEVAVDVGVNAHTGLNSSDDMAHDAKGIPKYQAQFKSAILQSYKHFGVKRSAIDTDTLTLKADAH